MKTIVIALGGNALGERPLEQKEKAIITAKNLLPIIKAGYKVIITHGNGPQVGLINLAFTEGNKLNEKVYNMPFSECGAMSEGYIAYHLQNALLNELKFNAIAKNVASIVTEVEVDKDDPAFLNPSKPIGSFYSKEEALKMNYPMKEDALRGYRRVVASPKPKRVIEEALIKTLIDNDYIVIALGGGGIPVIDNNGILEGVDAVIDKDYASSKLADDIDADYLLILTAIENARINFGKANEEKLHKISVEEAIKYNNEGHFYSGSMKPKIEAAIEFVKNKKERIAIITTIEKALEALELKSGTIIIN